MTDTMEESRALNLAITPTLSRRREREKIAIPS